MRQVWPDLLAPCGILPVTGSQAIPFIKPCLLVIQTPRYVSMSGRHISVKPSHSSSLQAVIHFFFVTQCYIWVPVTESNNGPLKSKMAILGYIIITPAAKKKCPMLIK